MDGKRFDKLTKVLTSTGSRRSAVKGLLAGAAASVAGALGLEAAAAQDSGRVGTLAQCRGTRDNCKKSSVCCSRRCVRGKCQCRQDGGACSVDRACCSGRCRDGECVGDGPVS